MSADAKTYTERDLILAKRAAFVKGGIVLGSNGTLAFMRYAERVADHHYPLPKITRPRVVDDPHTPGFRWRYDGDVSDGRMPFQVNYAPDVGVWFTPCATDTHVNIATKARIALWADLLANPTEEVEADA